MIRTRSLPAARALMLGATAALLAACGPDAAPAAQRPRADSAGVAAAPPKAAAGGAPDTLVVEAAPAGAPTRVVLHGVDLTGVGYDRGDPKAPVVMVEFSDFGCPYCAKHARETFPALERDFIATGKLFYKHVPFVMGMFPNGD